MTSLSAKTTDSANSGANNWKMPVWSMNEEIVISGIAGRFPESDNIDELKHNLNNNIDMISEDAKRWPSGLYGRPTRSGKIKDLGKFGAEFFGVNGKKADHMDPQSRLLLELTYEAIADSGFNPEVLRGTKTVEYPVARGTQSISSLIRWDHSQDWLVTLFPEYFNPSSSSDYTVSIELNEREEEYYTGHCIDGRILFPATGYLMLVWKMLAKTKGQSYDRIRVKFENVTLHRAAILPIEGKVKFVIRIMESSGDFSVTEGGNVVATGHVVVDEESNLWLKDLLSDGSVRSSDGLKLELKDIYKELRIRGYDYGKTFQGLVEANYDGKHGKIKYTGSWVAFVDAMLQLSILGKSSRGLYLPVRFQSIRVDPQVFSQAIEESGDNPVLEVVSDPRINVCTVRGIEIRGLKTILAPRRQGVQKLTIEKYRFVPYYEEKAFEKQDFDYLNQYIQVYSSLTQKVLQSLGQSSAQIQKSINRFEEIDNVLKEYLVTHEEQQILLKVLEELITFDNKVSLKE